MTVRCGSNSPNLLEEALPYTDGAQKLANLTHKAVRIYVSGNSKGRLILTKSLYTQEFTTPVTEARGPTGNLKSISSQLLQSERPDRAMLAAHF